MPTARRGGRVLVQVRRRIGTRRLAPVRCSLSLVMYARADCPLCDGMRAKLEAIIDAEGFRARSPAAQADGSRVGQLFSPSSPPLDVRYVDDESAPPSWRALASEVPVVAMYAQQTCSSEPP